jgi:hypothetical protein
MYNKSMKKFASIAFLVILFSFPGFLQAQSVDILSQGEGYVPPFYQGRNLWSKQAPLTLTAIPQGLGNPNNLNYVWIKNGTVLGLISGVGKNSMTVADSIFSKPVNIKVEITGADDSVLAENSINITAVAPEISVYENNPLYGFMFHREVVSSYKMDDEEVTFSAFPLFFSTPERTSAVVDYKWRTNGTQGEEQSSITYRTPEGASGFSNIEVRGSNNYVLSQTARKSFLIQFGDE